jgi:hypothetical protein
VINNIKVYTLDYKKIDLTQSAKKGFADISVYMQELGNLSNNMKAQQKLKLLNHKVILDGLHLLHGLNSTLDKKVDMLLSNINDALEVKKTPFLTIFSIHISIFMVLFFVTILFSPINSSIGYAVFSVGMGCATGVLNLMLMRERKKYKINNLFFILEEEGIDELEPLHKRLAKIIDDYRVENKLDEVEKLETELKETILKYLN